jgi:hypothetical protein
MEDLPSAFPGRPPTGTLNAIDPLNAQVAARLRHQAEDVRRLTSGLTEEQLARRTVAGKWSLKELVCHLWRVQQVLHARIDAMLADENPAFAKYAPEDDAEFEGIVERPFAETLGAFAADRERFLAALERMSDADWRRPGRHPSFPYLDVQFQVEYLMRHEAHHIFQMLERRAAFGKLPA